MGSEVQVDKYSGWLQMKSSGGLRTENGSGEIEMRTTSFGNRRRTTAVGFKWRRLVVGG